jgi:anti-anti-sigma factor
MTRDQYNGVTVLTVEGDLVGTEAAAVRDAVGSRAQINTAVATTDQSCVVDLERCRFVGGEGLETLLTVRRSCESRGGSLKLAGLDSNVRTILRITRLDHRFECCPDVAAALKLMC